MSLGAQQKSIIDNHPITADYDHFRLNKIKMYNLAPTKLKYEDVASRLLVISPILATANMPHNSSRLFTEVHKNLTELNEIYNNLISLIENELTCWCINIKIPAPVILPKIRNWEEFTKERDRLFVAVDEFAELYRCLMHVRKSREEGWKTEFVITVH